jgi:4-amino-4-deoxy-L-arabinose transferase-like glycosyltransferase
MTFMERSRIDWVVIWGCCIALLLLWLPGVGYPIVSDTAVYALLGEHLWQHGTYTFFGEPYAKHLPLHAFLSYPFVWLFGYGLGMKLSSLVAGWGVLVATYLLLAKTLSRQVALLSVVLLTAHHGFVLMTHFGSADLLFAALFLFAVVAYVQSSAQKRWYLLAFVLAGLASLTRYNGVPLFALFLGHAFLYRRNDLKSAPYIGGLGLGLGLIGSWFARNFLVFGDPLYTEYTAELSKESLGFIGQIVSNAVFYIQPTRNLLPILLLCALYGLWKYGRTQKFLVAAILTAWLLTSFWWVQGMRFAFPGYPILMGFAVMGLLDVCRNIRRPVLVGLLIVLTHLPALCLYSYGSCNAWFDRSVGLLPQNLGLSSEGFHTWSLARDYVNEHALPEAYVDATSPLLATVWQQGVFRSDLRPVENTEGLCPAYRIDEDPEGGNILFQTESFPQRYVHLFDCS